MPTKALEILNAIAATSSKTEKQTMLANGFKESPLLRRVVLAALDPFVTYGIARLPEYEAASDDLPKLSMDDESAWSLLDDLAKRKLSGSAAQLSVREALASMSAESRELFKRILLRDLRAGFGENTVNKVEKGAIKTFPYMRCSLPDKSNMANWDWSEGIIVQLKADGMFVNVTRGVGNEVWMTTRSGTPIPLDTPQLRALADAIVEALPENTQSHGEMTVFKGSELLSRKEGNGLLNSVLSGEGKFDDDNRVIVDLWDQIPLAEVVPKAKYKVPYVERFRGLVQQLDAYAKSLMAKGIASLIRIIPTKVVHSKAEALALYKTYLLQRMEGVICKKLTAIWIDGTSKDQVKLKLDFDVELEVYGFEPGTPGTKTESTFGSLKCKSSDGLLLVDVSGFTDAMRVQIHLDREGWTGAVITVRANDVIDSEDKEAKSLFLPRFIERRLDKNEADTLEKIEETKKAAVEA